MTQPSLGDRIDLWLSKGRVVDGLWIGSFSSDNEPSLQRVEAALRLIERHAPLHYRRIQASLERVWVNLVPHGTGCYLHSLSACVLDERVVASDTTTIEWVASTIVHEATHARLERLGIHYIEAKRLRIERICIRRERDFVQRLPDSESLLNEINQKLDWCRDGNEAYTDQNMWQDIDEGHVEALRYLGAPEWVINCAFRLRNLLHRMRRRTAARSS